MKDTFDYTGGVFPVLEQEISNSTIAVDFKASTEEEVEELINKTKPGEYISVANRNNLGEVFIYQRNQIHDEIPKRAKWNGVDSDTTWYNKNDTKFILTTAAQLKGFAVLVGLGETFKGKEVMLGNNIDLSYYPWTPIGKGYKLNTYYVDGDMRPRYVLEIDKEHSFQGIFNGWGHKIFGLSFGCDKIPTGGMFGFFATLYEAEVNNVVFEKVNLISPNDNYSFSTVAGVANNSIFTNVIVSGDISSAKPSGICGIAIDSAFYSCKNMANIHASVESDTGIVAGGICQQVTLTKKMINYLNGRAPKIFVNCTNDGNIYADGDGAKYLWIGHFFGGTYYEDNVAEFNFIMDLCTISYGATIRVNNGDKISGEVVYFGYGDDYVSTENNVGEHSKDDLLDGVIGRVDQYVGIEVVKMTSSTVIGNLVIPGTINTLISGAGENTFHTKGVSKIRNEEGVYNLEPFFRYIKTAKK